ncbi:solute carrier family 15 member 2 [Hyperolius riggenbachi]|uniref:solute carrier family 15 member 2 n=1 Tax=Hyperolius riggenbachi TaxID=752182 RepID=UPI0035A27B56
MSGLRDDPNILSPAGHKSGVRKFFSRDAVPTKRVPRICGTNYPLSIMFIIVNEFCERFSFYGMKAVLVLYFLNYLHWSENDSTTVYHAFSAICYFTPIFGAPIADAWLGKFNTIFWLSILYVIGHVIKSVGAIPTVGGTELHVALSMIGLVAIAFGTGGIKPCVSAFGGDQFDAEHAKERAKFFSIFYMSINAGSLLSTFVTPLLRGDVQCFGTDCYALAFGVPAALMFVALIVFVGGSGMYKKYPPQGNILGQFFKCIGFAINNRWRHRSSEHPKREHWLDWASEKYSKKIITEIKMVTKVLFLYIPLPMFWALFDQQGSRWTLQATRMNLDFKGFVAQPDQIQILNPLLILILIPIFDLGIYPLFRLCKLNIKPIPRMTIGMILAALAFAVATVVEIQTTETVPVAPKAGQVYMQVLNFAPDDVTVTLPDNAQPEFIQESLIANEFQDPKYVKLKISGPTIVTVGIPGTPEQSCQFEVLEKKDYTMLVDRGNTAGYCLHTEEERLKPPNGQTSVRFINLLPGTVTDIVIGESNITVVAREAFTDYLLLKRGNAEAKMQYNGQNYTVDLGMLNFGGAYSVVLKDVNEANKEITHYKVEDVEANNFHVAWQVPQYVLLSAGEVMFSVTGLDFSYSQAPANMKAVLQAGWLLTVAFGNVIVLIVAQASSLEQWAEFILFAALLIAVAIIFAIMGYFYVPVNPDDLKEEDDQADDIKKPPPNFYETIMDANMEEKKTKI